MLLTLFYQIWYFMSIYKCYILLYAALRKTITRHLLQDDNLSALMNGPIRTKLGIIPTNVTWGGMPFKM